jgi:recombination protein RecA
MAPKKKAKDEAVKSDSTIMTEKQIKVDFDKRFGEGSIFQFDDNASVSVFPISTGIPTVDYASGIGGLPLGRVVEVYGPESSGKTSLALMTVAQAQRISRDVSDSPIYGRKVLYIDAENALDPIHMKNLGVDLSKIMIAQPDHAEQALDMVEAACHSKQFSVIVIDSVPALVPKKILEGSNEDQTMGLLAKLLSQSISKTVKPANEGGTLVIFINQIREKVGGFSAYGTPETTPGGRALRFYPSVRLDIRRKEIKKGDVSIGQSTKVTFKKNKLSSPFTVAEYDYMWDGGVNMVKNIMEVAMELDVIKRAGAWYYFGEDSKNPLTDGAGNELKWMGKDAVEAVLTQSPALFAYTNDVVQGRIPKDAVFVEENNAEEIDEEAESSEEVTA